jgi:hypothetical protein
LICFWDGIPRGNLKLAGIKAGRRGRIYGLVVPMGGSIKKKEEKGKKKWPNKLMRNKKGYRERLT